MSAPRVSLLFPYRNHRRYVARALKSVLAQRYAPMEIIVSDDASDDGAPEQVLRVLRAYRGPHHVHLRSNPAPLGVENYNECMKLARGDLIVVAHSDDLAVPHRVERIVEAFDKHDVSMVSSNASLIGTEGDARGNLVQRGLEAAVELTPLSLARSGRSPLTHGATLAWHREIFDRFGPLDRSRSPFTTDWMLPFRAALLRGIHFIPDPLLKLRVHDESRSRKFIHHAQNSQLALRESMLASRSNQFAYLRDFVAGLLASEEQPSAQLEAILAALKSSTDGTFSEWLLTRNRLGIEGYRVGWERSSP